MIARGDRLGKHFVRLTASLFPHFRNEVSIGTVAACQVTALLRSFLEPFQILAPSTLFLF